MEAGLCAASIVQTRSFQPIQQRQVIGRATKRVLARVTWVCKSLAAPRSQRHRRLCQRLLTRADALNAAILDKQVALDDGILRVHRHKSAASDKIRFADAGGQARLRVSFLLKLPVSED